MADKHTPTPLNNAWEDPEAIEDSLEREAPNDDRRDRYSKEYGALANNSVAASEPETDMTPDGRETYPEGGDFLRARGENIEGSKVVEGDDDEAPMMQTPDSEGYASDWKGQHPSPEEIEDDEPKKRQIPPADPSLPSGR